MNFERLEKNKNLEDLKNFLLDGGIDFSDWGTGRAKTIENLFQEIKNNDIQLFKNEKGEVVRKYSVVCLSVYFIDKNNTKLHLKEERQVFDDGRERVRGFKDSVSEKKKNGELSQDAISRGLKEELGIDKFLSLRKISEEENEDSSISYPGLLSQRKKESFDVFLYEDTFSPDGYKEDQENLTTYFSWEKC
jgi:hypothetical protein